MGARIIARGAGATLAAVILAAGVTGAHAAVAEVTASGFAIEEHVHVAASPDKVYSALIEPAKWWNSDHTRSGNAINLTLDARAGGCLCEKLPNGGSVWHLAVAAVMPGSMLRFRGAMGPFQGQGADGALTFMLKPDGSGTDLTLEYNLGGFFKGGVGQGAAAADGMLSDLVDRLKRYSETPGR